MRKVTVSAPGKLMLLGEHAVVYDRPCIVTAVGQRMKVTIEQTPSSDFHLEAPDVKVEAYKKPMSELGKGEIPKGAKFVEIAVKNFIDSVTSTDPTNSVAVTGLRIETKSEFSSLFGFGSSSASTVCTIKALAELTERKLTNRQIFDIAYKTVLDVQGKGSGFDVAAAVFGGTLYFVTGGKTIEPLEIADIPLIVGYSGVKADTTSLINFVAEKAKKYPEVVGGIYNNITILVEHAKKSILENDWKSVGELMNFNQGYLESLGISIGKLSAMIYAARESGAFGAKLSGGGGGDCMIAVSPEEKNQAVKDAITSAGGQVIEVQTNVEGARVEE